MVALYIVVSLISIFSSVMATFGSEGLITLDVVLTEMSSMRNDMETKMSSMKNDMDNKVRTPSPSILRPQTSTPPAAPLPPQPAACSSYTELSDAWRHIDYVNRGRFPVHCDKTGSASVYTNLAWGSWYRFTGAAGTKLPTAPAPVGGHPDLDHICGAGGVAYISSGGNPTIQDGIVTRDVCFEWYDDNCEWGTTVKVAACRDMHGDYFVYQLQPVPRCWTAYCAID